MRSVRRVSLLLLMTTLLIGWKSESYRSTATELDTWLHTTQADWMAGERDHLDVRTLDALGTPFGLDLDPRGAMRLHSQPGRWTKSPESPVIEPGQEDAWDNAVISEAKVVFNGQNFDMWYAGRRRGPPGLKMPMDFGYATSPDGIHWRKPQAKPVLTRGPLGSYDENLVSAPYVLYDGERFHMWFSAVDFRVNWSINYASSPDGVRWTKHQENPLFEERDGDWWDADYIAEPCVIFNGSSFQMWYNGASSLWENRETLVGYASSPDGIQWSRLEENEPVLDVGQDRQWDDYAVARVHILYDGEEYKMWYEGHDGGTWRIGYATSGDGIRWERFAGNPIVDLGPEGAWDSRVASEPYALFDGRTYRLWHSGYDGDQYRVGLVTAPAVYDARGVFVSPPISSAHPVAWGTLTADLSLPEQTRVQFEVATSDDGQSWSGWAIAATECASGTNRIPLLDLGLSRSHYLRYRATLSTSDSAVSPQIYEIGITEAEPDFGMSLSQETASLQAGQITQLSVSFEPFYGFASPVRLNVEGSSSTLSAVWEPRWVIPPGSMVVSLGVSEKAQSGTIPLTITGKSGDLVHAVALSLRLVDPPPTATPVTTPTPLPTPTMLPTPTPLPPVDPSPFWRGIGIAGGSTGLTLIWFVLTLIIRRRKPRRELGNTPRRRPVWRYWIWAVLLFFVALWGLHQSQQYVASRRQEWEAYRAYARPGVHVAGIDVGGMTEEEIRQAVKEREIAPRFRTIEVCYLDHTATFNTADLEFDSNLNEIVAQAAMVGVEQESFDGFLLQNPEPFDVHFALTYTFEYDSLPYWIAERAAEIDTPPIEHQFDGEKLLFVRGKPGARLDTKEAIQGLQLAVPNLALSRVELPIIDVPPRDWTKDEIRTALTRVVPYWTQPPLPAISQSITIPFDFDRWIGPNTPTADWRPTRGMTGYTFLPGRMGWTLDVPAAQQRIRAALDMGVPLASARAFTDVAPSPLALADIKPLLLEIAAHFDGFTGFYVQDLTTGEEIRHNTYVTTSGMSMIKVAIMATAHRTITRPFSSDLKEAMSGMIAHSINEKSNYVILQIGEGDFQRGLALVNETLRALGMNQTYIAYGYRTETGPFYDPISVPDRPAVPIPKEEQIDLWPDTAMQTSLSDQASLLEALYRGTQGSGRLLEAFPNLTPRDCQEMLDLLKTNPTRTLLGPGFPDSVPMAHKNGFGGGQYTDERMNVGIVWPHNGRPYLVGLYQWDKVDWIHWLRVWPQQIELSTTLYSHFTMPPPLDAPPRPD